MMLWELKFPRRNAINRIIVHPVQAAAANQSATVALTAENVPNNLSCFTISILKEAFSVSENASFLPTQVGLFYRLTTGKLTAGTRNTESLRFQAHKHGLRFSTPFPHSVQPVKW